MGHVFRKHHCGFVEPIEYGFWWFATYDGGLRWFNCNNVPRYISKTVGDWKFFLIDMGSCGEVEVDDE